MKFYLFLKALWAIPVLVLLYSQSVKADETTLWMARAMLAESGIVNTQDQIAVGYTLIRQWERARRKVSLINIIRNYCTGLGEGDKVSYRIKWILELDEKGTKPPSYNTKIEGNWENPKKAWLEILEMARKVLNWELLDPCHGKSLHWGSVKDNPHPSLVRVTCDGVINIFYTIRQ
jgi:hypothetical protein